MARTGRRAISGARPVGDDLRAGIAIERRFGAGERGLAARHTGKSNRDARPRGRRPDRCFAPCRTSRRQAPRSRGSDRNRSVARRAPTSRRSESCFASAAGALSASATERPAARSTPKAASRSSPRSPSSPAPSPRCHPTRRPVRRCRFLDAPTRTSTRATSRL